MGQSEECKNAVVGRVNGALCGEGMLEGDLQRLYVPILGGEVDGVEAAPVGRREVCAVVDEHDQRVGVTRRGRRKQRRILAPWITDLEHPRARVEQRAAGRRVPVGAGLVQRRPLLTLGLLRKVGPVLDE